MAPELGDLSHTRGALARLFLAHAAELGITEADAVERVDDVAAIMMGLHTRAFRDGDQAWLARFRWFAEACDRLLHDQPAVPLDG